MSTDKIIVSEALRDLSDANMLAQKYPDAIMVETGSIFKKILPQCSGILRNLAQYIDDRQSLPESVDMMIFAQLIQGCEELPMTKNIKSPNLRIAKTKKTMVEKIVESFDTDEALREKMKEIMKRIPTEKEVKILATLIPPNADYSVKEVCKYMKNNPINNMARIDYYIKQVINDLNPTAIAEGR